MHRGQLIVLTGTPNLDDWMLQMLTILSGPMLTTGDELASAASSVLGTDMKFEDISPYVISQLPTVIAEQG